MKGSRSNKFRAYSILIAHGIGWIVPASCSAHSNRDFIPSVPIYGSKAVQKEKRLRPQPKLQEVKVYLIALGDNGRRGRKIGCEDSLVPVTRKIAAGAAPLKSALQQLLATPAVDERRKLQNFWKGKNLAVRKVALRNGLATIHISGEVFVAGICDEPRILSQIKETARQFPSVRRVNVFIGSQRLEEAIR